MAALKEVVHVFPMVSLNDSWTRLAVGDVIGEIKSASIRVYDLQRSELTCIFLTCVVSGHSRRPTTYMLFNINLLILSLLQSICCEKR